MARAIVIGLNYLFVVMIFAGILTFAGYVLDAYNPHPERYASYFDMETVFVGLPTWIQNILILALINGFAGLRLPLISVRLGKDFRAFVFPLSIVAINLLAIAVILFAFVFLRAMYAQG